LATAQQQIRQKEQELLDYRHRTFNIAEKIVDIEEKVPEDEPQESFGHSGRDSGSLRPKEIIEAIEDLVNSPEPEKEERLRDIARSLEGVDNRLAEMELELEVYRTQYQTNYDQIRHSFDLERQEIIQQLEEEIARLK